VIQEAQEDTKHHVKDTNDDGQLHFERVCKIQLVFRNLPDLK